MSKFRFLCVKTFCKSAKAVEYFFVWLLYKPFIRRLVIESFAKDGIQIGSDPIHPWDLLVKPENEKLVLLEFCTKGSLGYGETYMKGLWNTPDLVEHFRRCIGTGRAQATYNSNPVNKLEAWMANESFNVSDNVKHDIPKIGGDYDREQFILNAILGPTLIFSCASWKIATDLDSAQLEKMSIIGKKLDLRPGMRVLDMGCGNGALAKYLGLTYGVTVVGCNLSRKQIQYAQESIQDLEISVSFLLCDYAHVSGVYDRIVCIEIIEHIGEKNYTKFFSSIKDRLKPDGIFLLQTYGLQSNKIIDQLDLFEYKYVLPVRLPNSKELIDFTFNDFVIEDWENNTSDAVKTFQGYKKNLIQYWENTGNCKSSEEDIQTFRKWLYTLSAAEAGYSIRAVESWQIVFRKHGNLPDYRSIRLCSGNEH